MTLPSLSVVIPTYNEAAWLPLTLSALRTAVAQAEWPHVQIIVVDDGSTDETPQVLAADAGTPSVRVVRQENHGRFAARHAGLKEAEGELILLLDSRVFPHPSSLRFIREQLEQHPHRLVWNGDVTIASEGNPYAGFWAALVRIAWRRYFRTRTLTDFGPEEYDYYPKGTGFFIAPRTWLLEACEAFDSLYDDLSLASDDTHLIRPIVDRSRINISPDFMCTYNSRDSWEKFVRHTYHRGTTFVDGYLRPGSRFFAPLLGAIGASPIALLVALRRPGLAVSGTAAGIAGLYAAARMCGAERHDARALAALSVPFGVVYGAGIVRGLAQAAVSPRGGRGPLSVR
jgi:glycosyltransferase involved in cell wall biosynthesis